MRSAYIVMAMDERSAEEVRSVAFGALSEEEKTEAVLEAVRKIGEQYAEAMERLADA
jgi:hypothetical protein